MEQASQVGYDGTRRYRWMATLVDGRKRPTWAETKQDALDKAHARGWAIVCLEPAAEMSAQEAAELLGGAPPMTPKDFAIGQIVWRKPSGYGKGEWQAAEVVAIGRRWVTVSHPRYKYLTHMRERFDPATMRSDGGARSSSANYYPNKTSALRRTCPFCGTNTGLDLSGLASKLGKLGGLADTPAQAAARAKPKPGAGRPRKMVRPTNAV